MKLDSCDDCGGPFCIQKCSACKLLLCKSHHICPECDSGDHLFVYDDMRDARRWKRARARRDNPDG